MSEWYCLDLGEQKDAEQKRDSIKSLLWKTLSKSPNSLMGLFDDHREHNETITLFFTPETKELAIALNAKTCEKPSGKNIYFIGGDGHCPYEFFPENVRIPLNRE